MSVRIVLADDHRILRDALVSLLDREPDLEVVATVADGFAAVAAAHELCPDVVVMDVAMPLMNGIEATRRITSELPLVNVLCLSMSSDHHVVARALEAGASGYVLKGCGANDLTGAIRAVAANCSYLSAGVTGAVIRDLLARCSFDPDQPHLTARERTVLQLIAEGHNSSDIGRRLMISVKTVSSHREHLMAKLGVRSVAGLTKYAIRHGLTALELQTG